MTKLGYRVSEKMIITFIILTVLFLTIQFRMYFVFTQFICQTVLFNPPIRPHQVLPLWVRVDLRVIAMKGYSAFPKAPALLEPLHQIVYCHIQDTRVEVTALT